MTGIAPAGEGDPLRVTWEAPAGCPSADVVRERVDVLLGGGAESGAGMVIDARARVMDDGTWSVTLQLAGEDGARIRTIPGGLDCAEAAEAAAVVIAIAIDPEAAARVAAQPPVADPALDATNEGAVPEPGPVPEPDEPAEAEPQVAPAAVPDPAPVPLPIAARADAAPRTRRIGPVRGVAGLLGGVGFGRLPGVAGMLGVDGGIALPRARVTAGASYWFRRRETVRSADVDFRGWSVVLRGCPVFRVRPTIEILACGGFEIGQTIVRTRGIVGTTNPYALWIAWLAQPALVVLPLRWLGVRIGAELFGPFLRTTYRVAPVGEVWTPPPVGIRGLLAVEARFP